MSPDGFEVRRVPLERLPQLEMLRVFAHRPIMHGLTEVDVTGARCRIREEGERTGERPFTAFLIDCLARAVDEDRGVQGFWPRPPARGSRRVGGRSGGCGGCPGRSGPALAGPGELASEVEALRGSVELTSVGMSGSVDPSPDGRCAAARGVVGESS